MTTATYAALILAGAMALLAAGMVAIDLSQPPKPNIHFAIGAAKDRPEPVATKKADGTFVLYGKQVSEREFNAFLASISLDPNGASIGSNQLKD